MWPEFEIATRRYGIIGKLLQLEITKLVIIHEGEAEELKLFQVMGADERFTPSN